MRSIALSCAGLAAAFVLLPAVAQAQAPRTYVSSSGHGTADCSRAAPCVRFQDAHDATAPGGIVTCLDYGDYGELRITKSITIECNAAGARIGAPDTGIDVTGPVVFTLRGVWIDGGNVGAIGILMRAGGQLHVENCHISGLRGFPPGAGILLTGNNLDATIVDSVIGIMALRRAAAAS